MSKSIKQACLFPSILMVTAILFALVGLGGTATGPQIMAPTNRYINIVTYTLNTASTFNPSGFALSWNPFFYTVNFAYAKANTNYRCGVSVGQINYQISTSGYMDYSIDCDTKLTNGVKMAIYSTSANRINLLVTNTLTIQQGFMVYYFHYLTFSYSSKTLFPGDSVTSSKIGLMDPVLSDAVVYKSIIGLDIKTDSTFSFGLEISAVITSSTDVDVTFKSIGTATTTLYAINILLFIFSNNQLATAPPTPARYTLASMSSTSGNNPDLFWNSQLNRPYNTLIGLTSFKYTGSNFFQYSTSVDSGVSASASSTNTWSKLSFDVGVFQYTYCPDTLAYLMVPTSLCYDLCPIRYASNGSDFQCDPCPTYDCYYCGANGKCTECSATVDFRQMNNATMRCAPLPGYYDNGVSQAVPCDATKCLTCTSATSCLTCYTGKYLSGTTCLACMANCLNCTSATTCITCDTYYIFSVGACVPNCSNITNCSTCAVNSSILVCSACTAGYSVVNNTCQIVCGDGQLITPQVCDDNNTNPNDGCSPTCQVELGYFCNTASPTVCQPCSANCTMCSSPSLCINCTTGYTIISGACAVDCTVITFCANCSYDSTLPAPGTHCDICQTGYEIQANNTCASRCGDGIRVPNQGCDDGGAATPGCSATCTVEFAYFCVDTFPNASICTPCMAKCDICVDAVTCNNCSYGYVYDTTVTPPVCKADCTPISNCTFCTYSSSLALLCVNCSSGYQNNGANGCTAICGDGIVQPGQICDDGNTISGDGCSNVCQQESNFQCVTVGQTSACSLLSMNVALVSLMKTPTANSISVTYSVSPGTSPIFSNIDWSTVVQQQSNLPVTFSSFTFDSTTGQLVVNADYTQPLDAQLLQIGFNFPPQAPFDMLTPTNTSTVLVADNNLALGVYSSEDYGQVDMVGYVAMGASAAAAALFLLGFLKGKLVGLQCVTVFQLTFFSLLTCQNMTPSFYGLKYLAYSCGYNLKSLQKSSVNIGRRYNPVGHFEPFLENYNITAVLFLLPLILSLIFALVNRLAYKSSNEFLLKHSRLLRGEGCFYGLMFSAYEIVVSLGIEVTHMGSGMIGLAVGAALTLGIIVFGVLLRKYPEFFGEFTEKFNKESCIQSGYYCFLIGERVITAGCLVMAFFNPLGAVIAGLLAIQIIIVLAKKPYAGEHGWVRPFLNLLFSLLIQVVFIMTPMLSSMPTISRYAPLVIQGVLVVVLAYNIYYFIQTFRNPDGSTTQAVNQEENQINEEMNKLSMFQKQMSLNGPTISMLDKTNTSTAQPQTSELGSPSRLTGNMLSDVKDKLNKVKLSSADPNNISFAGSLDLNQDII